MTKGDMVNVEQRDRLRDALRAVIAHYDEHGAKTRGMDMILADCRKLLEEVDA
jgi:hypothetical protein